MKKTDRDFYITGIIGILMVILGSVVFCYGVKLLLEFLSR
jgi:hypothetical protein